MTWDVEGKLFPLGRTAKGEAYLEAAVGRVITTSNRINLPGKRVHGSLGAGYRFFCVSNPKRFLDLGLLYDGYTPRKAPVNTLSVKVGVGLLFGSCCAKSDTKATSKVEAKVPEKAAAKDEVKASAKVEPKATVTAEVKRPVKASAKAKKMVAEKTPTETK
jgi:hypothetical protein